MTSLLTTLRKRKWLLTVLLLVALVASQVQIADRDETARDEAMRELLSVNLGGKVITLGSVAEAAGSTDYQFDGVADDVQFQAALNALPATGGRLVVVSATTIVFTAATTVTRAIDNVTIEGTGRGTYFTGDGVTAIFAAGGNNWKFEDIRADAGSIAMGATTGWMWTNVLDNATYYAYRSPYGQSVVNDLTAASIGAFTLSGKLTAGVTEIEGSGFDIDGGDISAATVSGGLTWSSAQNFGAYTVYINDTANANMATGLTIQQAATADQGIALKDSGVATGLTDAVTNSVETDDYTTFSKFATATGGLMLQALGEDAVVTTNLLFESYGGQADTTKSTAGRSLIEVYASQHNGANALADVAANGNVFGIRARVGGADVMVWGADKDGDTWQTGSITALGGTLNAGLAGTTTGLVTLNGATSGTATLTVDAKALWFKLDKHIATGGYNPGGWARNIFGGNATSDGTSNEFYGQYYTGVLTGFSGDLTLAGTRMSNTITTQAVAETATYVAQLILDEPAITKNVTTITTAATLLIIGAPTEGTTNASIYVVTGDTNISTLTARGNAQFNGKASIGVTGTGTGVLEIDGATSGTVTLTVGATAGTWTMTLPAAVGAAGEQLTDAAGNGVTSWAAAASRREYKNILGESDAIAALDKILGTKVYDFRYKQGMGTGDSDTLYTGVMADEAGWAMHYQGGIVNPVNTLGYLVLGTQALNDKIERLEARIVQLEAK